MAVNSSDGDYAAWIAYRKANKNKEKRGGSVDMEKAVKAQGDGGSLNRINRKTGRGNRHDLRNGEYHLCPMCPLRGSSSKQSAPVASPQRASTRPPYSPIFMGSPVEVQARGLPSQQDFEGAREDPPRYSASFRR